MQSTISDKLKALSKRYPQIGRVNLMTIRAEEGFLVIESDDFNHVERRELRKLGVVVRPVDECRPD